MNSEQEPEAPAVSPASGDRVGAASAWLRARGVTPGAVAAWLVPATLIVYLALMNGGYGPGARGLVGVLVWVAIAVGSLISARPHAGVSRAGLLAFALLAAFSVWNVFAFAWTENSERTAIEVARVLAYLGVFALALGMQGLGRARQVLAGVTFGLTAVCALALMSRLQPNFFPERVSGQFIPVPEIERRLAYPLNYAGGIATLVTMTLPLLMVYASAARSVAARVLSAAALPMVIVALWLTGSGLLLAVGWVGLAVFIGLSHDRLPKLATLLVGLLGGALLAYAVVQLEALDRGLPTPEALAQGDRLMLYTVGVMIAVGAAQRWILVLGERLGRPGPRSVPGGPRRFLAGTVAACAAVLLALVLSGSLDSQFDRFQSLENVPVDAPRLAQVTDIGSSGRYQQWDTALDAAGSAPVLGIGPGTFEFWWARNGEYGGFVRDGHSLYLETFAELGIVGLALLLAVLGTVLYSGGRLAIAERGSAGTIRAGAVGAVAAFAAAAGVDWMWELGVLPVALLLVAGVALARSRLDESPQASPVERPAGGRRMGLARLGLAIAAIAAIPMIALPALAERHIDESRSDFEREDYPAAYDEALSAERLQPFAATPYLQQALVLEQTGQFDDAIEAAREAVERAPTDWRPRLVLSELERASGAESLAEITYEEARALNPRSSLFAE